MKRALASLLVLWLCACGSGGAGMGDDDDTVLTPQQFDQQLDEIWCAKYSECSGRAPVESCREHLGVSDGRVRFPWEAEQVASGRVIFHADRAAQCLAALDHVSCAAAVGFEWMDRADPVCLTVYEPAQAENQPCDYDFNGKLLRECKGWMACELDRTCDVTSTCCQGTCSTRAGDNPADQVGENGACVRDLDCQPQLACGPEGTCVVPRNVGDHCYYYCAGDAVCDGETCQNPPQILEGTTTCAGGNGTTTICDAAHYCGNDGHCWSFKQAGDACGDGVGVCDWFYACPNATHVCTLRANQGEACASADDCQSWHGRCLGGKCTSAVADGESCTLDNQCLSNHCAQGVCAELSVCDVSRD
jgi:hypothetical protein